LASTTPSSTTGSTVAAGGAATEEWGAAPPHHQHPRCGGGAGGVAAVLVRRLVRPRRSISTRQYPRRYPWREGDTTSPYPHGDAPLSTGRRRKGGRGAGGGGGGGGDTEANAQQTANLDTDGASLDPNGASLETFGANIGPSSGGNGANGGGGGNGAIGANVGGGNGVNRGGEVGEGNGANGIGGIGANRLGGNGAIGANIVGGNGASRLGGNGANGANGGKDLNGSVRRCSWFHKGAMDSTPVPYTEREAAGLEEAYRACVTSGKWHSAVEQEDGSRVVLHSPRALVHFTALDADFPTPVSANGTQAPLTVRRGTEDFEIEDGENETVNHLLLIVHGIGSVCDLKLRPVHQCVDDFRKLGRTLLSTHFREAVEAGEAGRVEVLPISWHKALHGEATGIDEKLRPITLRSIPKLREFTNDTILDALLYTSPVYCQHIIDTVASEMERLYSLYKQRNPHFNHLIFPHFHSSSGAI
ncbi:hypothetical protein Pcinc_041540, partial [Petrolisthes cinctipes]